MTKEVAPSPEQQAIYDWISTGSGSGVIEAVAGAGKTTTLVTGVSLMRGSIFIGAYNKKMGEELAQRTSHIRGVRAGTFHSAGFGALRYHMKSRGARIEVDDKKVKKIAQHLVHETRFTEYVGPICKLVGLAKQEGFLVRGLVERPEPRDWQRLVERHDIMDALSEGASMGQLIHLSAQALTLSNQSADVIDFDDMVYLPLFLGLRFFRNDWVLVDEAQDTNATRREMAARMLSPRGRLLAVGDPHQAIFGFTGADADSLELIRRQFRAVTMHLSVTFRCPKAVVRQAQEYVSHIRSHPNSPEGEVSTMSGPEMLRFVQPGDAILARNNQPLAEMCLRLIRSGVPAKIEGRDVGQSLISLITRLRPRGMVDLRNRLKKWRDAEVEKAVQADDEGRQERIDDQYGTILVLISRAEDLRISTVGGLTEMIRSMFDDVGEDPRLVVLSSVHRSKGLEWDRVFILNRRETMPSKRAVQDWQYGQEINLIYVALTRAKRTLVDVEIDRDEQWRD